MDNIDSHESYCDANEFYSNASNYCKNKQKKNSEFVEGTLGKLWRRKIYEWHLRLIIPQQRPKTH